MAKLTDPAKELYEVIQALSEHSNSRGDEFLAGKFGVDAYSTAFYRIIGAIMSRADTIAALVPRLGLDEEIETNALSDLQNVKGAFTSGPLRSPWKESGGAIISQHGRGLQYLQLRHIEAYPKLESDEAEELLDFVKSYKMTFDPTGLPVFLAQAIRDGLDQAIFHLTHLRWTGGAYQLQTFRELEAARTALESWATEPASSVFHPELMLQGLGKITKRFFDTVSSAKGFTDNLLWLTLGYNTAAPALGLPSIPQLPAS